jgi:hypothetical protein
MRGHRKAKKSTPKTTARQQTVFKARLKLLTQNFFSCKIEAMNGNNKVIMSRKITQQDQVPSKRFVVVGCEYM